MATRNSVTIGKDSNMSMMATTSAQNLPQHQFGEGFGPRVITIDLNTPPDKKKLIFGLEASKVLDLFKGTLPEAVRYIPITLGELGFKSNPKEPFKSNLMSVSTLVEWGVEHISPHVNLSRLEPEEILFLGRYNVPVPPLCWIQPNGNTDIVLRFWRSRIFNRLDFELDTTNPAFSWPRERIFLFKVEM